jgi:hypothetical protein
MNAAFTPRQHEEKPGICAMLKQLQKKKLKKDRGAA